MIRDWFELARLTFLQTRAGGLWLQRPYLTKAAAANARRYAVPARGRVPA